MKELVDIKGIITVLNTPFDEENKIHLESLKKNVSLAIKAGVAGFLVPAMASEVEKLSGKEREEMVNAVLDEANGKVPVIGGASAHSSEERKRIARSLIEWYQCSVIRLPATSTAGTRLGGPLELTVNGLLP